MVANVDWAKLNPLGSQGPKDYKPGEAQPALNLDWQPKWDIPEKVSIQATVSGGGAGFQKTHNPNHPCDIDEIRESAEECIQAGATVVHLDIEPVAMVYRNGKREESFARAYEYVARPLIEKYGRDKVCFHINCLRGAYEDAMTPVVTGLAEVSYLNPSNSPTWLQTSAKLFREYNTAAEIVVHHSAKIDMAERYLIGPGLMPNPNLWIVLPALLLQSPSRMHDYYPNQKAMVEGLMFLVNRIHDVDPKGFITICCAGRPSRYLTTLGLLLGLHIRVGMEDTVWKYPHKDIKLKSNGEEVREAIEIARLLGREVMTPNEYREANGIRAKTGRE